MGKALRPICIAALLALTACVQTVAPSDAGCDTYGRQRVDMPRPLDASPLAGWVSVTDAAMTAACRG